MSAETSPAFRVSLPARPADYPSPPDPVCAPDCAGGAGRASPNALAVYAESGSCGRTSTGTEDPDGSGIRKLVLYKPRHGHGGQHAPGRAAVNTHVLRGVILQNFPVRRGDV